MSLKSFFVHMRKICKASRNIWNIISKSHITVIHTHCNILLVAQVILILLHLVSQMLAFIVNPKKNITYCMKSKKLFFVQYVLKGN